MLYLSQESLFTIGLSFVCGLDCSKFNYSAVSLEVSSPLWRIWCQELTTLGHQCGTHVVLISEMLKVDELS